ncbi:MAG: two-component system, NarL family, nitrate/nitrite response regulator NarL [Frankiaceae bacterium]|jgi:DNA-binding NarL/FixJ family response regulator|nr:two-component system, NarL family, nitrate/nitrite response regulator NarL [Frankiaceae bacterium]
MGGMNQRVLVVDDEPDLRRLLRWLLELDDRCSGIAEAEDSESALREAAKLVPHAVILDFMLGDTTADEMLPALRAACPEARIVVYTAAPERAEAADVIERGADAVAAKAGGSVDDIIELVLRRGSVPVEGGEEGGPG